MTVRPSEVLLALNAVKRFLKRQVKYSYISDLQIGCESNQKKVNLLKPNQDLPNIESFPVMMILEVPEFGLIY